MLQPVIARPRRYRSWLPGDIPTIDWTNPRTKGLLAFYVPGSGWLGDIARIAGPVLTRNSAAASGSSAQGRGDLAIATNSGLSGVLPAALKPANVSLSWCGTIYGTGAGGNNNPLLFGASFNNSIGLPYYPWGIANQTSANTVGIYSDFGGTFTIGPQAAFLPTGFTVLGADFVSGAQNLYLNGAVTGVPGTATGSLSYSSTSMLCIDHYFGQVDYPNALTLTAGIWGRSRQPWEYQADARDPFGFLIFAEDWRRVRRVGTTSGKSVSVLYPLGSESLLAQRIAREMTAEMQAAPFAAASIGVEAGRTTRATATASAESSAALRRATAVADETTTHARRSIAIGDEWGGAALITAASFGALEFAGGLGATVRLAVESGAISRTTASVTVELRRIVRQPAPTAGEALAGAIGAAGINDEWISAFAAIATIAGLPIEALALLRRNGAASTEWAGTVTLVAATAPLPIEWRITAATPAAAVVTATASARLRTASATRRLRTATFVPNLIMSQARDLFPAQDALVEGERIGFDFGPALAAGTGIAAISSVTCAVYSGADFTPAARVLGSPQIIASAATGIAAGQVTQLFGGLLPQVTYRLQCVVQTSDGQTLSLWAHLSSRAPN